MKQLTLDEYNNILYSEENIAQSAFATMPDPYQERVRSLNTSINRSLNELYNDIQSLLDPNNVTSNNIASIQYKIHNIVMMSDTRLDICAGGSFVYGCLTENTDLRAKGWRAPVNKEDENKNEV